MKRKLSIALTLALIALLVFSSTALAWDVEDPCVADNEDFFGGGGWDNGDLVSYTGGQLGDGEGYNLYQDDATDTGNLDEVLVYTLTPDKIDLPLIGPWLAGLVIMGDESPDTWYWATEPRGYNNPEPIVVVPREDDRDYLRIVLPDDAENFLRKGTLRYGDINFSDGTWLIQIPANLQIWSSKGGAAEKIIIDGSGNILSNIRLAGPGDIVITKI